jgi:hypothetical protein
VPTNSATIFRNEVLRRQSDAISPVGLDDFGSFVI